MTDTTQARDHRSSSDRGVADKSAVASSAPFLSHNSSSRLAQLTIDSAAGGLVFLGPSAAPVCALESLLGAPDVEAVEVPGERMCSWITSPDEVLLVTRAASSIIRAGHTAVVHLDSHCEGGPQPVRAEDCDFVSCRLGRIMVGLADTPAFIAILGEPMATGFFDAVGESEIDSLGVVGEDLAMIALSDRSMFPALPVAVTSASRPATAIADAVDWFEARRR